MATLYQELVAAGVKIGNHCSDLYFEWTDVSSEILKRHEAEWPPGSFFTSKDPADAGATWCEVSFAYDPFWQRVENEARAKARDAEKTTG